VASVVDLAPPPRVGPTPSYRKIRAASRGLEMLFAALLVFFVALMIVSLAILLFYQGTQIAIGPRGGLISFDGRLPADFIPFRDWRLDQKLAYVPIVIVRAIPSLALFWCLRQLFRLYGQGVVFAARNAALIKAMGVCLIADAIAPFACHVVLSATGYEIDKMWAHQRAVQELVLGAVVFVIALVMQAGREIEEDREGFV
jgi:hypothetical protein